MLPICYSRHEYQSISFIILNNVCQELTQDVKVDIADLVSTPATQGGYVLDILFLIER